MSDETKNVFISHVHEDDELVKNLKDLLGKNGYQVRDGSIDSSKPNDAKSEEYIKSGVLAPRINWASTLIVLVSPKTKDSWWVNWEVEYAEKQGKRIVGVWANGAQGTEAPDTVDMYADAMVGWQADRVIDAMTGKINNWTDPDGTTRAARSIPRYSCGTAANR